MTNCPIYLWITNLFPSEFDSQCSSDKFQIVVLVYDGNWNWNNKEMSENVFSWESNLGLMVSGQMPYQVLDHWTDPAIPYSTTCISY